MLDDLLVFFQDCTLCAGNGYTLAYVGPGTFERQTCDRCFGLRYTVEIVE